jgi:hypothetical protein
MPVLPLVESELSDLSELIQIKHADRNSACAAKCRQVLD